MLLRLLRSCYMLIINAYAIVFHLSKVRVLGMDFFICIYFIIFFQNHLYQQEFEVINWYPSRFEVNVTTPMYIFNTEWGIAGTIESWWDITRFSLSKYMWSCIIMDVLSVKEMTIKLRILSYKILIWPVLSLSILFIIHSSVVLRLPLIYCSLCTSNYFVHILISLLFICSLFSPHIVVRSLLIL